MRRLDCGMVARITGNEVAGMRARSFIVIVAFAAFAMVALSVPAHAEPTERTAEERQGRSSRFGPPTEKELDDASRFMAEHAPNR